MNDYYFCIYCYFMLVARSNLMFLFDDISKTGTWGYIVFLNQILVAVLVLTQL